MKTRFSWLVAVSGSFQHVQKTMSVNENGKCIVVPLLNMGVSGRRHNPVGLPCRETKSGS